MNFLFVLCGIKGPNLNYKLGFFFFFVGLESSKDDGAFLEKSTDLNKSKDSNNIVITDLSCTPYHQNYLQHSKENQCLVATPIPAETPPAPKNIIVQRKSGKFEKPNNQITVVHYNPKQTELTELTRHNIKINPIVQSKVQRFNCEKCPGIEFAKNDELIQHIISNHCKKVTAKSSETSVQNLKRKSDGSVIINGEKIMVQSVQMQTPKSGALTPELTNIQVT